MNLFTQLVLLGWPLVVFVLFGALSPRRAVLAAFFAAWMFLPVAAMQLSGLPDITKTSMTCVGVLLGVAVFDPARFLSLRPTLLDAPLIAWCLVPVPAAISSGYGLYDGASGTLQAIVAWGLPYLIGRLYFSEAQALRELAIAMFLGGLIYVPFVLFEARMSPQLHILVYGYFQHSFEQTVRGNGWRPTVFMEHGLAVAMFMGTAAICGTWLWRSGKLRHMSGVPVWFLALGLFATAAACRSMYALMLMLLGTAVLFATRALRTRLLLVIILAISPAYVTVRVAGLWDARDLGQLAIYLGDAERLASLETRLRSEDVLLRSIGSDILFGGGRLDFVFASASTTDSTFIADALWIITLGKYGILGLVALFGMLLGPTCLLLYRFRPAEFLQPDLAGATVLACVLILYTMDGLMNAMVNPIYLLACGGLVALKKNRAVGNPAGAAMPVQRAMTR